MLDVDTIVSLSTAPGVGAIAMVRVSGPDATRVLQGIVGPDATLPAPRVPSLMELLDPEEGSQLDRAVVTRFAAPASYTGEDMLELSCHGGWLIPQLVVDACVRAGARVAEPGEFTKRAYLRGKLDLTQAEAIADLIEARSRALHRAALGQLERGLSNRIGALRERLVSVEALLVHHIDFPEEDDPPVPLQRVVDEAGGLLRELDAMLSTAPEGELLREGALTVFAGRPNAGKSSLYNAVIGEDRAIVTDEPGTTRDALEATVLLGGFPFRLVDTAGLRPATGSVEMLGVEIAQRYVGRADVLLYCVSAEEGLTDADRIFLETERDVPVVLVETKDDLAESRVLDANHGSGLELAARLRVSVETGRGLDQLHEVLPELVYSRVISAGAESPVVLRQRHARALTVARNEIAGFRTGLLEGLPAEVAATHLRPAETALEEILGVVSVDDVLDVVFRDFCVGK